MKKHMLIFWITALLLMSLVSQAQYYYFIVHDSDVVAIPGSGLDIRIDIDFEDTPINPVYLSAETPDGILAIFQPDSVKESKTVILSVIVEDTNLKGQNRDIKLIADDGSWRIEKWVHLQIPDDIYVFSELSTLYRDSALHFLYKQYPDMQTKYGNLISYPWQGFWPWPILLVVSNYNFLYDDWRINVLWHNMIYPHNWEKVFIFNDQLNICKGVKIDSIGNCSEIPCEKRYYFQILDPSGINNNSRNIESEELIIYPVPASDFVYFRTLNQPAQKIRAVRIYNQMGNCINEINIDDVAGSLNISMLPAGIYVLRFGFGKYSISKKLVVY